MPVDRPVRYTSREHPEIMADLLENLRTIFGGEVNDFYESNEGRFLLEQMGGIADMVGYTADQYAAESFIDTVRDRYNLASLLRLIGYQPQNPTPETVLLKVSRTAATVNLTIPKWTVALSATDVVVKKWVTSSEVTMPAGTTSVTVPAIQGEWVPITMTANGRPYSTIVLESKQIADGKLRVFVDDVEWGVALDNTTVGHGPDDLVFRYVNLPDKRVAVQFGSGAEGFVPPLGSTLEIRYLSTSGAAGHIDAGSITSIQVGGVTVTNPAPSSGGRDFETIDSARRRYPEAFKTQNRAVTLSDWEAQSLLVPGVLQARAVDRNIDSSLMHTKVVVYVIGHGSTVSQSLNDEVREHLRNMRVNGIVYDVLSPIQVPVTVRGTITVMRTASQSDVLSAVNSVVTDFFTLTAEDSELEIGTDVRWSRLVAAIQDVDGVAYVNLTTPRQDVTVESNEYATIDTLDITVAGVV